MLGRAQAVFWGVQAPKYTPVAQGKLLSFGRNSCLGEQISHLQRGGGAQAVIWGHGPEMLSRGAGPAFLPPQKRLFL